MMGHKLLVGLILLIPAGVLGQAPLVLPQFDRRTPAVLAVQNVGPAVVSIRSTGSVRRPHLFDDLFLRPKRTQAIGSGVIIHASGYLVTNEHVVHGATSISVRLRDGRNLKARLIRANLESDLAVLKLDAPGPFPHAVFADSKQLLVGETTFALGNPFGLSNSITTGVLSATGREVAFRGKAFFHDFLQTSALINPGNSGGPLLDINGRVIGINVAIDTRGQGIGYAIPSNRVREVMTALVDPEMVRQAWLGFEVQELNQAVVVGDVDADSPGRQAGLRHGDILRTVAGNTVRSKFDLFVKLLRFGPGDDVQLGVERARRRIPVKLHLSSFADILQHPGMKCVDLTPELAPRFGLRANTPGVVVLEIEPGTPAARIELRRGDIIVQLGEFTVTDTRSLARILAFYGRKHVSAKIVIYRRGEKYSGTLAF